MFVIFLVGILSAAEGGLLRRRQSGGSGGGFFGNGSQPFPGQELGQQLGEQFGGQQLGQFGQQFGQFGQQFGQSPFQPPSQLQPFIPPQFQGQQQQQQQQQGGQENAQRTDVKPEATPIPIVTLQVQPNLGDGKYQYSYETGNGIKMEESGSQKPIGEQVGTVSAGSYSYTDPQGNLVEVTYTADENGFVARGPHIPTTPPVPKEILEALEKNAAEEAAENAGAISPSYQYFFKSAHPSYQNNRYRYH